MGIETDSDDVRNGLADVLEVNDKHWSLTISKADEVGGFVRVEVANV